VRRNAATCIREVSRHTPELAQLVVSAGGHAALVEYTNEAEGNARLPGIMALGYIAAYSETLALAVIVAKGIIPLKDALVNEKEDHVKAAAAWSLGQLGHHTPQHAQALAQADIFRRLVDVFNDANSSNDLKTKAQRALKGLGLNCAVMRAAHLLTRILSLSLSLSRSQNPAEVHLRAGARAAAAHCAGAHC
jgi:hypothetical protein